MSKAMRQMGSYCANPNEEPLPQPFPVLPGMPFRQEKWAALMHQDCDIESCSFLMYISDFEFAQESVDRLISHTDRMNGKWHGWDYLATFWESYFDDDIRRWVLIVASATSRSSIEAYHVREGKVGKATDILLKAYRSHPEWQ
jgi:hypothetical protein